MKMSMSIDGFVAGPRGDNDWIFRSSDEESRAWAEARVFDGDLATEISKLKSEPGKPIAAIGGAGFMRSLIATGLIDEYHLVTHPIVLGEGLAIFDGVARPMDLELVDVKAFPGGVVAHTYRRPD